MGGNGMIGILRAFFLRRNRGYIFSKRKSYKNESIYIVIVYIFYIIKFRQIYNY